jgi:O-antigen/teichoic acid export membrane protein
LRILAIYIICFSLGLVASHYIVSARMEKLYFVSVIAGGILSVLLCLFLIPTLGGVGAAMSLLIAHSMSMGLYWVAMILHVRNHE